MLLLADFIPMCGNDALIRMFQSGTSVSGRFVLESAAQSGTQTAGLLFSPQFEQVDRWPYTLLRGAGFGGASVPLAIFACPSRYNNAGETPAPPIHANSLVGMRHSLPRQVLQWDAGQNNFVQRLRRKFLHQPQRPAPCSGPRSIR